MVSPFERSMSVSTKEVALPAIAMMGWMLESWASLMAKAPTAVAPPYMTRGVCSLVGFHGRGSLSRWYKPRAAVIAARGIVAASVPSLDPSRALA